MLSWGQDSGNVLTEFRHWLEYIVIWMRENQDIFKKNSKTKITKEE